VKLYGALLGKEAEADAAFRAEVDKIKALEGLESTDKTVAFFYVNSNGNVVTYKTNGYVPAMIRIAGGEYIFNDLGLDDDSKLSTVNMNMEEFYYTAKDADIIIYNCSIVSQLHTLEEFLEQSPVLKDFKAVKEGNVWCTSRSMFQQTDKMGSIIEEMNKIFTGEAQGDELTYIFKLQ
jgi:iron complex transport system substrate-binding protein